LKTTKDYQPKVESIADVIFYVLNSCLKYIRGAVTEELRTA
jgi:hypothetical protein